MFSALLLMLVEFEMDDGLYRLEKRFLRRTMARLTTPKGHVIEGNEAETAVQKILHLEQDDTLPLDKGAVLKKSMKLNTRKPLRSAMKKLFRASSSGTGLICPVV